MPEASPIRLDESQALIVVHCTEHDWYRACRFYRDEALEAACGHEEREHPGDYRQRRAALMRHARSVSRV